MILDKLRLWPLKIQSWKPSYLHYQLLVHPIMAENLLFPAQLQNDLNVYISDQKPSRADISELSACAGNAYLFICEQYVWGRQGFTP